MSWAKRNIYFLASCIVAVVLLGAAGWYCFSSWQSNTANGEQLKTSYDQLQQLAAKNPNAGNDTVDNIKAAKEQTAEMKQRVAEMEKFFTPIHSIPDTNHFNDRMMAFAVRETVSQLRASAQARSVTLPVLTPESFAFSFSLQMGKTIYDPNSLDMLAKQLGEVKTICETLYAARITALDAVQRERTTDDANAAQASTQPDYTDSIAVTNGNTVITPYQVTFECFTPQLGAVLSGFANQQHTMVVKTIDIQPVDFGMGVGMGMGMGMGMGNPQDYGPGRTDVAQPQAGAGRGLPTAIDEKKLKVIMLVDVIKIVPAQGR